MIKIKSEEEILRTLLHNGYTRDRAGNYMKPGYKPFLHYYFEYCGTEIEENEEMDLSWYVDEKVRPLSNSIVDQFLSSGVIIEMVKRDFLPSDNILFVEIHKGGHLPLSVYNTQKYAVYLKPYYHVKMNKLLYCAGYLEENNTLYICNEVQ
jgi:hypothetical protein